MIRISFVALAALILLSSEPCSQAAVTISSSMVDTPGLPGFKTVTVFADSTSQIWAIDFAGDGSNDPLIGKGLFGPLYQASGLSQTVFDVSPGGDPLPDLLDSHFLIKDMRNIRYLVMAQEGPNLLQANIGAYWPQSSHAPIAQVVVPSGAVVDYRGTILANSRQTIGEFDVSGSIVAIPEPATVMFGLNRPCTIRDSPPCLTIDRQAAPASLGLSASPRRCRLC